MATNDEAVIPREPLTPEFQGISPLLDQVLPPLTPEEEAEVDRLMTETPQYQNIMETCQQIKSDALKAATQAIAIGELIQEGKIPEENLGIAMETMAAAAKAALEGRIVLDEFSSSLKEAGLPPGDCEIKSNTQPEQSTTPGPR